MNNHKYEDQSIVPKLISTMTNNGFEIFGHRSGNEKVACREINHPLLPEKKYNPLTAKVNVITFKKVVEKGFPNVLGEENYSIEIVHFPQSGLMDKFTAIMLGDEINEVVSSTAKDGSSFDNTDEVFQKVINHINAPQPRG